MSEGSAQYFLTPGELKKFTQALVQALYDRATEEERQVRYYYDADIVVWMVLGLFGDIPKNRDVKEDLIRALLSAGLLGEVHVLRPHALELRNRIANAETSAFIRKMKEPAAFRRRIAENFGDAKVLDQLDALDSALTGEPSADKRLDIFLNEVKTFGPQTFIAYELARGNWQERLATLSRNVLRFEGFGEDIDRILEEYPEIWSLNEAIVEARHAEMPEDKKAHRPKSLNDLSDAIALATLSRLMMASQHDSQVPEVRFHTNTRRLLKAASSPSLRGLFRYPVSLAWDKEKAFDTDFVFRGTDYYILRASFKALHFRGMSDTSDGDDVTIADLDDVRRDLLNAWQQYEQPSDRAEAEKQLLSQVEGIRVGRGSLRDTLVELERSSFLARLLKVYKTPTSVSSFLKERAMTDVFAAEETEPAAARLAEEAKELATDLTGKLTGIARWFGPTREIILAVDRLSKSEDDHFEITDAVRDLGLVRWAPDPDPNEVKAAVSKARDLFSKVEHKANHAAAEMSREVERPTGGEGRALANAALLWQLGLFGLVNRLINAYQDRHDRLPLSLEIMRKAARLRSKEDSSMEELKKQVSELRDAVEQVADPQTRGRYFIGLAYITFYIAFRRDNRDHPLMEAFDTHEPHDVDVKFWAEESFQHAERAFELLASDALARAFAVNHAAYVGAVYHLHEDRTNEYLRKLRELSRTGDTAWHYRFADTVGIAAYRAGYDAFKNAASDGEPHGQEAACDHLAEAESILKTANPYFGDAEIPRHRREIKRLQDLIGCPSSRANLPSPSA